MHYRLVYFCITQCQVKGEADRAASKLRVKLRVKLTELQRSDRVFSY
jgi:hypothetical protein